MSGRSNSESRCCVASRHRGKARRGADAPHGLYRRSHGSSEPGLLLGAFRGCSPYREARGALRGLIFIDLDGLKLINDVHGHDVGDEVLAATARRVKACLRGTDEVLGGLLVDMDERNRVLRLGGYEFTVLLSKVDGAEGVCERIVGTLAEPLTIGDVSVTVRAGLGVALLPEHAMNEEDLLCLSDRALYEEKRSGACGYRFA